MKTVILILFVTMGVLLLSCSQKTLAPHYTYKTECLGGKLDGSQTLKSWGNGSSTADAVAQAKKNAIRDVIFKGIMEGKKECYLKPLVFEVNAQEKHESYFNSFFADGGDYNDFISSIDEKKIDKKQTNERITCGVIVRVLRAELKEKLKEDGIIK